MTWSMVNTCYNCKRAEECPDKKGFEEAMQAINTYPLHNEKGGSGTVAVVCSKHE